MAELGGYGLIDVNALNISIKSSWISRWQREEDWRDYPSYYATGRNVGDIEQMVQLRIAIPDIIRDIMGKWDSFTKLYYDYEGNILEAPMFENRVQYYQLIYGQTVLMAYSQGKDGGYYGITG